MEDNKVSTSWQSRRLCLLSPTLPLQRDTLVQNFMEKNMLTTKMFTCVCCNTCRQRSTQATSPGKRGKQKVRMIAVRTLGLTKERLLAIEVLSRDHLEFEGSQAISESRKAAIRELLEEVLRLGEQLERRQYIWDLADEDLVRR